jgi:hypothetical protein
MTDLDFQADLAQIQIPKLAKATAQTVEQNQENQTERALRSNTYNATIDNLWKYFAGNIAHLYNLFRPNRSIRSLNREGEYVIVPSEKIFQVTEESGLTSVAKREAEADIRAAEKRGKGSVISEKARKRIEDLEKSTEQATSEKTENINVKEASLDNETSNEAAEQFQVSKGLFDAVPTEASENVIGSEESYVTEYAIPRLGVTKLIEGIMSEPGYRGNILLEFASVFEDILAAPEGNITALAGKGSISSELQASASGAATKPITKTAPTKVDRTAKQMQDEYPLGGKLNTPSLVKKLTTPELRSNIDMSNWWGKVVRNLQNTAAPIKSLEEFYDALGKIKTTGDKINNVFSQITLSTGRAWSEFSWRVSPVANTVVKAVSEFAKKSNIGVQEALRALQGYSIVLHEPERRAIKYLQTVPLDDVDVIYTWQGKNYTAQGMREKFLIDLAAPSKDSASADKDAKMLKEHLDAITLDPKNWAKTVKSGKKDVATTPELFQLYNEKYNVIGGITKNELDAMKAWYTGPKSKYDLKSMQAVMDEISKLHEVTKQLNKEAFYWSQSVQKIATFYNYKHYVPFKGHPNISKIDEDLDYGNSKRLGADLTDKESPFYGRQSDSENPILQSLADATKAARRLGQKDLTLSIKNAVLDGILAGDAKVNIPFADRYLKSDALKPTLGETKVLHYEEDGSITVISLTDRVQREAIRRTYEKSDPFWDAANVVTSLIGQTHTRFNVSFAPMNFVRDALTNAFTLGAKFGPQKSTQLIAEISRLASTKMFASGQVGYYLANNKIDELSALEKADKSGFITDAITYLKKGGRVAHMQGLSARSQLEDISKKIGRNGILKTTDEVVKLFDYWSDTFELTSRVATYRVLKQMYLVENKEKKMPAAKALEDAEVRATVGAKNLANFEQVGKYGKQAGAMFVFFKPAATGAVQAIEALSPYFGFNEEKFRTKAAGKATEAEIDAAVKKSRDRVSSTRKMTNGLIGLGMFAYLAAFMMADDDDRGRNKVVTDDRARWTRYARFFIPGIETPFQIPWGFGLGSFAAAGAQILSAAMGHTSIKDLMFNTAQIGMDNYLPIQPSRMDGFENPIAWAIDTAMPSVVRPFIEYVMNKDALGRDIYNNRQTRSGNAYTGGDNIPEAYKAAAHFAFDATKGGIDISPNSLYFWASNYADGLAKVFTSGYGLKLLATGEKDFNPKTDLLLLDSFFGAPGNIDSKEFSSVEKQIQDIERRLNTLKATPDLYAAYIADHPNYQHLVNFYNKQVGGGLNHIRKQINDIRLLRDITPKQRTDMIKNLQPASNIVKRSLIDVFKQTSDITP